MAAIITPCKKPTFKRYKYFNGKDYLSIRKIIQEFIDSPADCVEVNWESHYATYDSCFTSFSNSLKHFHLYPNIRIRTSDKRVFIVKENQNADNC